MLRVALEREAKTRHFPAGLLRLPIDFPAVFLVEFVDGSFNHATFDVIEIGRLLLGDFHRHAEVGDIVISPTRIVKTTQQVEQATAINRSQRTSVFGIDLRKVFFQTHERGQ